MKPYLLGLLAFLMLTGCAPQPKPFHIVLPPQQIELSNPTPSPKPQSQIVDNVYHNETFDFSLEVPEWLANALEFVEEEDGVAIHYIPAKKEPWGGEIGFIHWVTDFKSYTKACEYFHYVAYPMLATPDGVFYMEIGRYGGVDYDVQDVRIRMDAVMEAMGLQDGTIVNRMNAPVALAEIPLEAQIPNLSILDYDSQGGRFGCNGIFLYITRAGQLYSWGFDQFGKIQGELEKDCDPTFIADQVKAAASSLSKIYYIDETDTLRVWNPKENTSEVLLEDVISVKCGLNDYIALNKEGDAYQGSDVEEPTQRIGCVVQVCALEQGMAVLTNQGVVIAWDFWTEEGPMEYPTQLAVQIQEIATTGGQGFQMLTLDNKVLAGNLAQDYGTPQANWPVVAENVTHLCDGGFLKADNSFWGYADGGPICLGENMVNGAYSCGKGLMETLDGQLLTIENNVVSTPTNFKLEE